MKKELQITRRFAVMMLIFSLLLQTAIPVVIFANDNSKIYSVSEFKSQVKDGEKVKVRGYIGEPWEQKRSSKTSSNRVTNFELSDKLESPEKSGIPVEYTNSYHKKHPDSYEKYKGKLVIIEGTKNKYLKIKDGLKNIKSIIPADSPEVNNGENKADTSVVKEIEEKDTASLKKNEEDKTQKTSKSKKRVKREKKKQENVEKTEKSRKSEKTEKKKKENKNKSTKKSKRTKNNSKETKQSKKTPKRKSNKSDISNKKETDLRLSELKFVKIADVLKGDIGEKFTTSGYVISRPRAFGQHSFVIKDEDGNAIFIYTYIDAKVKLGDYVVLTGYLSENNGVKQLENIEESIVNNNDKENKFEIKEMKISDLKDENLSDFIEIKDSKVKSSRDLGFAFSINIEQNGNCATILINKASNISLNKIQDGAMINVKGILSKFNTTYQIMPFEDEHLTINNESLYKYVKIGQVQGEGLTSPYEGKKVKVKDVVVTALENGNNFFVQDIEDDKNEKTSDALVVNIANKNDENKQINVGDVLEFEGYVEEKNGNGFKDSKYTDLTITKVVAKSYKVTSKNHALPAVKYLEQRDIPIDVKKVNGRKSYINTINFWESKESMLVGIKNAKILGPMVRGQIFVSLDKNFSRYNKMNGITLNENGNPDIIGINIQYSQKGENKYYYNDITVKSGDEIKEYTGPLTYSYGSYKIYVSRDNRDDFKNKIIKNQLKREETDINFEEDKLTIASYNIENFAPKSGESSDDKVKKIAESIHKNLKNPDIISLVEMQDDSGEEKSKKDDQKSREVSARENAKILIEAIKNAGGNEYKYEEIEPQFNKDGGAPGSNIRVAFLYNPERVKFKSSERIGEDKFEFEEVRKSLAATFEFKDKEVLIIANHLNSKRGDEPQFGKNQPPVNSSEIKREKLAQIIHKYVVDKKQGNPKLNVVLTGDFNDFEFSKTLKTLEGKVLTNLVTKHDEKDRFSYFHNGNSQTLDHILVSNKLVKDAKFDMVHINSMFMEEDGRASDHDPVIVQLKLNDIEEKVENYEIPKDDTKVTPIKDLFNSKLGKTYKIQGIVTSKSGIFGKHSFYIQDETGYGIFVNNEYRINLQQGDKVELKGKLDNYFGLWQLKDIEILNKEKSTVINPKDIKINEISEQNPYTLVKFDNVTVDYMEQSNGYGSTRFMIFDKDGNPMNVNYDNRAGEKYSKLKERLKNGYKINLIGILSYKNGIPEILVVSPEGIEIKSMANIKIQYFKVGQIQGTAHKSLLEQRNVKVKDVVVTALDGKDAFYIQDINPDKDEKTSDGIHVFKTNHNVKVGDVVEIDGKVRETFGDGYSSKYKSDLSITEISAKTIINTGKTEKIKVHKIFKNSIPSKYIDNDRFIKFDPQEDAIDFWESIEGMIVELNGAKVIGPQISKQVYVLPLDSEQKLNKLGGVNLDKNNNPNIIGLDVNDDIKVKAGDQITNSIKGPVTYGFGNYKIVVSGKLEIKEFDKKDDKTNIVKDKDKLTVATYNVENFTALNDEKKGTTEEKVQKIANSIVNDLNAPDIITLLEVQDDDGPTDSGNVSATESGKRLTQAIANLPNGVKYTYVDIAPENNKDGGQPGGNIRIGLIYNPDRVEFKNVEAIGKGNPLFNGVRKSLVSNFEFNGEKVMVVANHLNSKIGDDGLFGAKQPPIFKTEVKRVKLAKVINEYIAKKLNENPKLNVVVTGDFNDYENTSTLKTIAGNELINLVDRHAEDDRFSFFFRGISQTLDHILVSKNIADKSVFDMIHINSLYMESHGRASDHDPVMVQISFMKKVIEETDKQIPDDSSLSDKIDKSSKENETPKVDESDKNNISLDKNKESVKTEIPYVKTENSNKNDLDEKVNSEDLEKVKLDKNNEKDIDNSIKDNLKNNEKSNEDFNNLSNLNKISENTNDKKNNTQKEKVVRSTIEEKNTLISIDNNKKESIKVSEKTDKTESVKVSEKTDKTESVNVPEKTDKKEEKLVISDKKVEEKNNSKEMLEDSQEDKSRILDYVIISLVITVVAFSTVVFAKKS
ncbi:endonuclease/exonuclease/phosphatase family protein [Helcococcus ovis]|uniref:endonuclease/exonuclease/phosphatase family protein n=1 Tax=Helcococcus ovis TaxID=72026 RepID=UPI0038BB39F6